MYKFGKIWTQCEYCHETFAQQYHNHKICGHYACYKQSKVDLAKNKLVALVAPLMKANNMEGECPIMFAKSHLRYLDEQYLKRNREGTHTTLTTSKDLQVRRRKLRASLMLVDKYASYNQTEVSRVYFKGLTP
ncbi:MAG: hypothetical protein CMP53_09005 [Flavobacteriales bacterium]|nr:hypothetical protein [Flavobacteriales bacterium]|tara:strand:- start:1005 stop:1403 length:399 start_codon:yes stop_codon:yes gene_type:complete